MNNSTDSKLQAEYNDLRKRYIKVLTDNQHLRYQLKQLTDLACALSDEDAPTPSFLKEAFDE